MLPGSTFDRYTIESVLGEGGMGTVYRAYDSKLQRAVALKLLRRDPEAPTESPMRGNARLLREARAAAALSHSNAVAIYDVGEHEGVAFISMELVEGRSLRTLVGDPGLRMSTRVAIVVDVARALAAAHARGLIHRDVKPENVMIRVDGAVKVLDFGLARALRDGDAPAKSSEDPTRGAMGAHSTRDSAMAGTPRYMAPEQIRGEPLDARTDQFSWGVLAYELLTGRPPWPGDTASLSLVAAIENDAPLPPEQVEPGVPAAAAGATMPALAKVPSERFASMSDVVSALVPRTPAPPPLETTLSAASVHALPTDPGPLPPRPRSRRRALVAASLLVLVAALGLSATRFVHFGDRAPAAASVALAPPPVPTAVTDLPVPDSEIPAAKAAYVAGLHAFHDGSPAAALPSFLQAAELDPSMAAAHVRVVMWGQFDASAHEHLARANELRARLSERDERVLWMLEPWYLSTPPDEKEVSRRALELAQRWPLDAELQLWAASREADPRKEAALYERVLSIDPSFGFAFVRLSVVHLLLADYAGALDALDRCLAVAPSSYGCLSSRASAYEELGRCQEMERDARLMASTSSSFRSQDMLARALYAGGAPVQAVHAALEAKWAAAKGAKGETARRRDEAHLAILRGDFVAAERLQRELAAAVENATTEDEHATAVIPLVELEEELGQNALAARLADQYVKARSAWQSDGAWSRLPEMLAVASQGRLLTEAQRGAALAAWRKDWDQIEGPLHAQQWVIGYAIPATTDVDAVAALEVAPQPLPRVHANQFHREGLEANGRVLLLAGHAADAVPYLRAAVAACNALEVPLEHTQALLHLGLALEQTGDRAGACQAYSGVLERWGGVRPRSVTAERARARVGAMHCR